MVAGYCWDWNSKKIPSDYDIILPEFHFKKRWNLNTDKNLWIIGDKSIEEIGCIHTCQGLELDYVGVIIGPDMRYEMDRSLLMSLNVLVTINLSKDLSHSLHTIEAKLFKMLMRL